MLPSLKSRLSKHRLCQFNWLSWVLALVAIVVAPLQIICVCKGVNGLTCSCSSILGSGICNSRDGGCCESVRSGCCDTSSAMSDSCCEAKEPATQDCDSDTNQNLCNDCQCVCSYLLGAMPPIEATTGPEQTSAPLTIARLAPIYELIPSSEFLFESRLDVAVPSVRLHALLSVWLN